MRPSGAVLIEDRGLLRVAGPEARDFLQGLITNDMAKVSQARSVYAALLTPQGKFLFDFIVFQHNDGFVLDTERETLPALLKRLTMYKLRANVSIDDISDDLASLPSSARRSRKSIA